MSNLKIKIFFILIVGLVYSSSILQPALSQSNFERIPVTMYRLVDAEEAISLRRTAGSVHPNWTLCTQGATLYGCTTLDGGPYPYDRSTIEVPFENVYLPNVLAQEMGSDYFPQAAKDAQAIAARTYALHLWDQYNEIKRRYDAGDDNWKPVPINNSTQFQAFIPNAFDELGGGNKDIGDGVDATPCGSSDLNSSQQTICTALRNSIGLYLADSEIKTNITDTPPNNIPRSVTQPIRAEFFSELRYPASSTNSSSSIAWEYLKGVIEPISENSSLGSQAGGDNAGMSQNGASRWAHGSTSYRGDPKKPAWPVRWRSVSTLLLTTIATSTVFEWCASPHLIPDR